MEIFHIIILILLLSLVIGHIIDVWVTENRKKKEESKRL